MRNRFGRREKREGYNLNGRYIFVLVVILGMFVYLFSGLAELQLRSSTDYEEKAESRRTTEVVLRGSRGMITDADAVILAKDEPIYNVTFYRDASQNSQSQYRNFTLSIQQAIEIIENNGNELSVSFVIRRNENTNDWEFYFGSGVSESVLQTRENQWRDNNYFTVTSVPTAADAMTRLKKRYKIANSVEEREQNRREAEAAGRSYVDDVVMDEETMLKVMAVYSEMQMNLFNSQPIVIAKDVPYETVIEIETKSMTLSGMEIAVGTKRVYPRSTLAAQVIGYMGAIPSADKWSELQKKGYKYSDTIGVDGIEASMEDWLTQNSDLRQGYRVVERDRVGKITRELSYTEPQDGNNVKLTIVASYQQQAERALAENVASVRTSQEKKLMDNTWLEKNKSIIENRNWEQYPLSLAQRAAMTVIDMEGRVLAMANYPTYDLNALTAAGKESAGDSDRHPQRADELQHPRPRHPRLHFQDGLRPWRADRRQALHQRDHLRRRLLHQIQLRPFHRAQVLESSESQRYKHQYQTIVEGLSHSCNYFFYTLGDRLGETRLYQYAANFGFTSKTGIDLPGEVRSVVGCQTSLYDPDKAMDEASQDTSMPIIVFNSIKKHLRNQGASRNITYDDERLNRCVKRLMDMAVNTNQADWVQSMRPILMEELNMTREMVHLQVVIGDTYNYLNDIKWGGDQTIQVAIGQSITTVSPAAVARYVAALGNGGKVYNLTIVDSITSPEGDIVTQRTPSLMHDFGEDSPNTEEYLSYILKGMEGVVDESGTAERYFRNWQYQKDICAKTGTAEVHYA